MNHLLIVCFCISTQNEDLQGHPVLVSQVHEALGLPEALSRVAVSDPPTGVGLLVLRVFWIFNFRVKWLLGLGFVRVSWFVGLGGF